MIESKRIALVEAGCQNGGSSEILKVAVQPDRYRNRFKLLKNLSVATGNDKTKAKD